LVPKKQFSSYLIWTKQTNLMPQMFLLQTLKAEEKKTRQREREALKKEIAAREKEEQRRREMEER
jgi:hypothetical protein